MGSCEYLKVSKPKQRRTEILRLRNIRFLRGAKQLDHDHLELEFEDSIALTFELQKKDEKMNTVTLMASHEACLCLERAAAAIVRRIWKYPSMSQDSPISTSTVTINECLAQVTSTHMINALTDTVGDSRGKTGHK